MHVRNCWRVNTAIMLCGLVLVGFFVISAFAADPQPSMPADRDKCPVCGMFVAKYPDFVAQVRFRDGSTAFFDGVKDMLKYFQDLPRYAPGRKKTDIAAIYVKDYYSLGHINGYRAYYVVGSDVYGPMGKELIPFGKRADALEFLKDHKGRVVLTFREIDAAIMKGLE